MQVVGDHDHRAAPFMADLGDQPEQLDLAVDVHPLGRFVQGQQVRFPEQGPGHQDPLQFAAGKILHRRVEQGGCPHFRQNLD